MIARTPRTRAALTTVVIAGLALTGCASNDAPAAAEQPDSSAIADTRFGSVAYPLTVETAYGAVSIPSAPSRIVSSDEVITQVLAEHDAAFVGVVDLTPFTDNVGYPWLPNELRDGGALFDRQLFSEAFVTNPEAVAALEPDLIFVSEWEQPENVERLSAIAPVIAPAPEQGQDEVATAMLALGFSDDEVKDYLEQAGQTLRAAIGDDFTGGRDVTFQSILPSEDGIGIGNASSTLFTNWEQLGLLVEPGAAEPSAETATSLSWEQLGELTADVLFVDVLREQAEPLLTADARWQQLPAVQHDLVFYSSDPEWEYANRAVLSTVSGAEYFANSELVAAVREGIAGH